MSQELANSRRALSKVASDLKQGQGLSAATAIRDAARMVSRVPLLKNEHDEFVILLQSATDHVKYNKDIAKIFPLAIAYVPGKEDDLADLMNQLIEALQETSLEEARARQKEYQAAQLAKAHKELLAGRLEEGRRILDQLQEEYSDDVELVTEIGETFASAGLYDDAVRHLELAARLAPDSAHVLNRLGIVLRRLKRYDEAEYVYSQAVVLEQEDPNLYFNIGRLYFDMGQWKRVRDAARKALELAPEFAEAAKMQTYAERKIAEEGT